MPYRLMKDIRFYKFFFNFCFSMPSDVLLFKIECYPVNDY